MHYQHSCAYRLPNGEVEGFRGHGKGHGTPIQQKRQAKDDAHEQIRRKLKIINDCKPGTNAVFDEAAVINFTKDLKPGELKIVRKDWQTAVRY